MSHLGKYKSGYDVTNILIKVGNLALSSNDVTLSDIILENVYPVTSLVMPNLTSVSGLIRIKNNNEKLTSVDLSALTSCNNLEIQENDILGTIDLSSLPSTGNNFTINTNSTLTSIDFSSLIGFGQTTTIDSNPALASLSFPSLANGGNYWYITNNVGLVSIDFPVLTSAGYWNSEISGNDSLTSLSFPQMSVGGSFFIHTNPSLVSIDFPELTDGASYLSIYNNVSLTTLTLPSLQNIAYWDSSISGNPALTSLSFPSLIGGNTLTINSNSSLSSIFIPSTFLGLGLNFAGNALIQSGSGSVNEILVNLDTAGQSDGILNLSGGTNAAPSGAGLTSKANLVGKGWTVTTN